MLAIKHPSRVWGAAGAAVALLGLAILVATATTGGRRSVLAQLERPASPSVAPVAAPVRTVGPGPVRVNTAAGEYRADLTLAPNRAGARDGVRMVLTRAGHRVRGATVSLGYSMPSMGMPQVLASTLREQADGSYRTLDPELAMPGMWRLTFRVTPAAGRAFTVVIDDRMRR